MMIFLCKSGDVCSSLVLFFSPPLFSPLIYLSQPLSLMMIFLCKSGDVCSSLVLFFSPPLFSPLIYLSQPLSPSLSLSSSRPRPVPFPFPVVYRWLFSVVNRCVDSSVVNQTLPTGRRTFVACSTW
jgi:hypothetical protein